MTLDLHPEDLLDRASMGTIAPDEQRRLDAHLALCDVCRFETTARHAFREEDSNASNDLDALVASALQSPQLLAPKQAVNDSAQVEALPTLPMNRLAGLSRMSRMRPQMQKRAVLLLAAALVLVSVQALAGKWNVLRLFVPAATTLPNEGETETSEVPHARVKSANVHKPAASVGSAGTTEDLVPQEAESPSVDSLEAVAVAAAAAAPVTPVAPVPTPAASSVAAHVTPKGDADKAAFVPLETATQLFEHASRDRSRGDHAAAKAEFGQLFHRFPLSPEATLGRATYGRMLLDDGDAEGALVQLDTYLAEGDSALREQAFAARATALGRDGQFDQEVQTWQRLLREYPGSLYSVRAHERIEEVLAR